MEAANEAVLGVFEREVLHPDVIDMVVRKALDKFRTAQQDKKQDRQRYHQQIAAVNVESSRLVAAIAAGGISPHSWKLLKNVIAVKQSCSRN